MRRAANGEFYTLQMEEEYGEGPDALPVLIEDSHDLLFANLYLYRAVHSYSPAPYAVRVKNSSALQFRGGHLYGPSKFNFDATVYIVDHDTAIASPVRAAGVRPTRVVGGFNNIEGAGADRQTLFICARHSLYALPVKIPGLGSRASAPSSSEGMVICITEDSGFNSSPGINAL